MADNELNKLWEFLLRHEELETAHQEKVNKRLQDIENTLAQLSGGWKALLVLGSIITVLAGAGSWIWNNILHATISIR